MPSGARLTALEPRTYICPWLEHTGPEVINTFSYSTPKYARNPESVLLRVSCSNGDYETVRAQTPVEYVFLYTVSGRRKFFECGDKKCLLPARHYGEAVPVHWSMEIETSGVIYAVN